MTSTFDSICAAALMAVIWINLGAVAVMSAVGAAINLARLCRAGRKEDRR